MNVRFKQNVVAYVWVVPTLILSYKVLTFPTVSVFQSHAFSVFHYYFGGGFSISEYRNWQEFWSIARVNADIVARNGAATFHSSFLRGSGLQPRRIDRRSNLISSRQGYDEGC